MKQIILLAASREKFASIAAKPRVGSFSDTSLALTGWSDCSVYGSRTYTCDFQTMKSAEEAEAAQSKIVQEIKTCLDNTWTEDKDRSSSVFAVLHHPIGFVSMTVSTDEKANGQHVRRLPNAYRISHEPEPVTGYVPCRGGIAFRVSKAKLATKIPITASARDVASDPLHVSACGELQQTQAARERAPAWTGA